ncbi:Phosphorylated adapter RNA export protein [Galemys pyrenaicus]|uniref:Phosphorylated adapter RNA export protein n=1 Tax=Galemys pyrenaicus TaxID=202257 RepID=A0A8J6DR47_GALPY|nr:Phosphorylated adapter RNA export protein [Galemys pyrenaicus]
MAQEAGDMEDGQLSDSDSDMAVAPSDRPLQVPVSVVFGLRASLSRAASFSRSADFAEKVEPRYFCPKWPVELSFARPRFLNWRWGLSACLSAFESWRHRCDLRQAGSSASLPNTPVCTMNGNSAPLVVRIDWSMQYAAVPDKC